MFSSLSTVTAFASLLAASIVTGAPLDSSPTLANNFTLAALNNTLPNANSTGAPLVLGSAGAISGASLHTSSTYLSYPFNDFPSLGLVGGNLRAFDVGGNWNTNASLPSTGDSLNWVTSSFFHDPAFTVYSAVSSSSGSFPVLAINGISDLWFLCPSDATLGQNSVFFNTTSVASSKGADRIECYSVVLNMVPV